MYVHVYVCFMKLTLLKNIAHSSPPSPFRMYFIGVWCFLMVRFSLEYCRNDGMSSSGHHIREACGVRLPLPSDVNFNHQVMVFSDFSSVLLLYFPLGTNKQSVERHFKTCLHPAPPQNYPLYFTSIHESCLNQSLLWWSHRGGLSIPLLCPHLLVDTQHFEVNCMPSILERCSFGLYQGMWDLEFHKKHIHD